MKYKPSNASKPVPEPSSIFGRLLQVSQPVAPTEPQQQPSVAQPDNVPPAGSNASAAEQATANPAPQIISAYAATASRVIAQGLETTTELA